MLCFQSIIFSFNGGGEPEKSIPNALVANSRNFTALEKTYFHAHRIKL